jgi:hypothetical protein
MKEDQRLIFFYSELVSQANFNTSYKDVKSLEKKGVIMVVNIRDAFDFFHSNMNQSGLEITHKMGGEKINHLTALEDKVSHALLIIDLNKLRYSPLNYDNDNRVQGFKVAYKVYLERKNKKK